MLKIWTEEQEKSLISFYNTQSFKYSSLEAVARGWIQRSGSDKTVDAVVKKIRRMFDSKLIVPKDNLNTSSFSCSYDELVNEFNNYLGRTFKGEKKKVPSNASSEKVLVLSDLHIPLTRWDCLFRIVDMAVKMGIKRCWLNGDVYDFDYFSRFHNKKFMFTGPDGKKYPLTLDNEIKFGQFFRDYICERFDVVYEIEGNHRERPRKYFLDKGLSEELIGVLMQGLEKVFADKEWGNYKIITNSHADGPIINFYGVLGDCILCHFEFSSNRIRGGQVRKADEWFERWEDSLPGVKDAKVIIQGHSHGAVKMVGDYGRILIECPSLCSISSYMVSGKEAFFAVPVTGYVILVQDENGRTDIDNTNFYLV